MRIHNMYCGKLFIKIRPEKHRSVRVCFVFDIFGCQIPTGDNLSGQRWTLGLQAIGNLYTFQTIFNLVNKFRNTRRKHEKYQMQNILTVQKPNSSVMFCASFLFEIQCYDNLAGSLTRWIISQLQICNSSNNSLMVTSDSDTFSDAECKFRSYLSVKPHL